MQKTFYLRRITIIAVTMLMNAGACAGGSAEPDDSGAGGNDQTGGDNSQSSGGSGGEGQAGSGGEEAGGNGGESSAGGEAGSVAGSGGAGGTQTTGGAGGTGGTNSSTGGTGGTAGSGGTAVIEKPNTEGSTATYLEKDGIVAVEAEHYFEQARKGKRAWYFTSPDKEPMVTPDPDKSHVKLKPSGQAYMEILPDTRVSDADSLSNAFFASGGSGPTLRFRVRFTNPGKYWVWARAFSTGPEDNGVHVGIDDNWPSTGNEMQWCAKSVWSWSSAKRDTGGVACGINNTISLEVKTAGEHTIEFGMREDGFEMDKWLMVKDGTYMPTGFGPDEVVAQ